MAAREQRSQNSEGYEKVAHEGSYLVTSLICEQMQLDGIADTPSLEQLLEPSARRGEHMREIGQAIRYMADEFSKDREYQELVSRVPPDAEQQILISVAENIFQDGIFNWGRVASLIYFAYTVCVKAVRSLALMRNIISTIVRFMRRHVIQWVLEQGGWGAVVEYLDNSKKHIRYLVLGSLALCAGVFVYQKYLR